MYPVAGIIVWLALGAIIGFFAGKVTGTSGPFGVGSNTGVGMGSAVLAGFITTVVCNGEKSGTGLWLSMVVAGAAAFISIAIFRALYPVRSPRFEDGQNRLQ
jgi:uncharacterized membrane protein YeaQ/YmgE (transglycosylase-associated protein family)